MNKKQGNTQANNKKKAATASQKSSMVPRPPQGMTSTMLSQLLAQLQPKLSKCAENYARSLADPFNGPQDACVPNYPALQTKRQRVWVKGVAVTSNTTGIGFVVCDPRNSMASDSGSVSFSSNATTFIGTGFPPAAAAAGTTGVGTNSEFQAADFGDDPDQILGRVVSCGLRVRYTGTELGRGGQLVCVQHPLHAQIAGDDPPAVDAIEESIRLPVPSNKWTNILYRPLDTADLEMSSAVANIYGDPNFPDAWYMGVLLIAPDPATSVSYEFEFYANHELNGQNVRGRLPSHVDYAGFAAVHATSQLSSYLRPSQEPSASLASRFLGGAEKYLKEGLSWAWNHKGEIGGVVASGLSALGL